jgi:hypothetical protein
MTAEIDSAGNLGDEQRPSYKDGTLARFLRRNLPRTLFARSLLIIVIPMVLLQIVVAAVFMERHWQMVTTPDGPADHHHTRHGLAGAAADPALLDPRSHLVGGDQRPDQPSFLAEHERRQENGRDPHQDR